jgi:hypothetical protein
MLTLYVKPVHATNTDEGLIALEELRDPGYDGICYIEIIKCGSIGNSPHLCWVDPTIGNIQSSFIRIVTQVMCHEYNTTLEEYHLPTYLPTSSPSTLEKGGYINVAGLGRNRYGLELQSASGPPPRPDKQKQVLYQIPNQRCTSFSRNKNIKIPSRCSI